MSGFAAAGSGQTRCDAEMAAAWIQLVVLAALCLAGVQAKPNPVEVQLLMLEACALPCLHLDAFTCCAVGQEQDCSASTVTDPVVTLHSTSSCALRTAAALGVRSTVNISDDRACWSSSTNCITLLRLSLQPLRHG